MPGGAFATVTPLSGTYTFVQGTALKISGVELYKVQVDPQYSQQLRIRVDLLNGYDLGKVLNNPYAFINVGIYDPVSHPPDDTPVYTLADKTTVVRIVHQRPLII